jgi:hypothetical protein
MPDARKRRSPKEVIESTSNQELEHSFIKYPGEEPVDITRKSSSTKVYSDTFEALNIMDKHGMKPYTFIHTHPTTLDNLTRYKYSTHFSRADLRHFMMSTLAKASVIAVRDPSTGKVQGYSIISKTDKTPIILSYPLKGIINPFLNKLGKGDHLEEDIRDMVSSDNLSSKMKKFASKYYLKQKIIPAEGYHPRAHFFEKDSDDPGYAEYIRKLNEDGFSHLQSLEKKTESILAILGFLGAIFFLSQNFTGNAIGFADSSNWNWVGIILFMVGLIETYLYFRK